MVKLGVKPTGLRNGGWKDLKGPSIVPSNCFHGFGKLLQGFIHIFFCHLDFTRRQPGKKPSNICRIDIKNGWALENVPPFNPNYLGYFMLNFSGVTGLNLLNIGGTSSQTCVICTCSSVTSQLPISHKNLLNYGNGMGSLWEISKSLSRNGLTSAFFFQLLCLSIVKVFF